MKKSTIFVYVIGVVVIGVIIYFLIKWRNKLETEKKDLESGKSILIKKDIKDILPEEKITESIDISQIKKP